MSDAVATSQVEEVKNADSEQVQQKVVESEKVHQEEPAKAEEEVSKSNDKEQVDKPTEEKEPTESEAATDDAAATTTTTTTEVDDSEPEKKEQQQPEVVGDLAEKQFESNRDGEKATNGSAEHSEETNGKATVDDVKNNNQSQVESEVKPESGPVVEETNGMCKRKVPETETEVAADEKSPKKAKVVEDGDKAQVEETAA